MFGRFRKQPEESATATAEPVTTAELGHDEAVADRAEEASSAGAGASARASTRGTGTPTAAPELAPAAIDRPLEERIVDALKTIFDPEIPVNIYELGLIYDVAVPENESGPVGIKMTLTSPHCPVAESLPGDVKRRVEAVEGVSEADVEIVWDPAWNPEMMSEAAKLELGFF